VADRTNKGQFIAGKSGNPGGQPKNAEWRELLKEKTPEVLARLFEMTQADSAQIRLRAIEIVLSYSLPKPTQQQVIELTGALHHAGIDAPRSETREEWEARRAALKLNGTNGTHTNGAGS